MKTVFILNPEAGKGRGLDKLRDKIERTAQALHEEVGTYITKARGDGEAFAHLAVQEAKSKGEKIKLIACGGDGTLNEIVNGMVGYDGAAVGVMPTGTGNDFVRNFPEAGDFMSVKAQLLGDIKRCDLIKYSGLLEGRHQTRYCANMFNIGFDCNVVDLTARLKKYPLLKGSFAYLTAVLGILIKKKGAKLKIEIDDELIEEGAVLLTAMANGGYCGGGVNSSPKASIDDGYMDVNIIYNVTRREFVKKFPYYSKGTHMELPDIDRLLWFKQCKKARITPLEGTMRLCTDGEIVDAGQVTMEVIPKAINVVIPAVGRD